MNLTEPEFLAFFQLLAAGAISAAFAVRWWLRPAGAVDAGATGLQPYQLAWLAGGPRRAGDAALAQLFRDGALSASGASLVQRAPGYSRTDPLERGALEEAASSPTGPSLRKAVARRAEALAGQLVSLGLATTAAENLKIRLASAAVLLVPLCVGGHRLLEGIAAGQPVLVLWVLLLATLCLCLWLALRDARVTDAGAAAVNRARVVAAGPEAPADAALNVGLFGLSMMPDELKTLLEGDGGGGGDGDGDGGDGGCGGCGGCGD